MAANIKVKSDSQQFKSDMRSMADSIKLTASEFQVAQTKANLFGTAQEKLQANINSLNSKLQGQNSILSLQKEGFNKISNEIDKYKARNTELTSAIDKKSNAAKEELRINGENTAEYKKIVSELSKLQSEYNKNNTAIGKNETSLNSLKLKMNQTQTEILQTEKSLDTFGKELDQSGKKSKDLEKNVNDLKEKFSGVGEVAKKAGGAIVAGLGVGLGVTVKGANDTQQALNDLQVKTGLSTEKMSEMGDIAKDVFEAGMGENIDEVTDTMALLNQTIWLSGDELKTATNNSLLLADTFDADVNDTVKTTNSLMKNFGITSEESMTLMAQGFQNGGNASGDLLDSMNEYSVQFATMGFSAEDFTNILIDGSVSGAFSIDKIGDAVKEFNIRSKDGSKSTTEAYKALGLNADELSGKFAKGGATGQEAFKQVMDAINQTDDPIKKNQIGVSLYGTMWEDLGVDAIKSLSSIGDNANKSADTLKKINDIKYNDIGSQFLSIGRSLKNGLADTISKNILPKLQEFAKTIQDNMPLIQEKVGNTINIVVPLFEGFVKVIGFAIDNSNWLIPVLAGLAGSFIALQTISFIIGLMKTWAIITEGLTVIQGIFNVVLSANPIGLVIIAIGALIAIGVALWMNWDKIKEKCGQFAISISEKWNTLLSDTGRIFNNIGEAIMRPIDWAKDRVRSAIDSIKGFFDFQWSFPHLKMPHFTWSGSVNPLKWGEVGTPSVGVEWYKNGGIMNSPTMFGMNGNNAMIGGEAGAEAILPLSQLWNQLEKNFNKLEQRLSSNNSQVIEITNITTLDGKVIAIETTKKVIKQLTKKNKDLKISKGGLGIA